MDEGNYSAGPERPSTRPPSTHDRHAHASIPIVNILSPHLELQTKNRAKPDIPPMTPDSWLTNKGFARFEQRGNEVVSSAHERTSTKVQRFEVE